MHVMAEAAAAQGDWRNAARWLLGDLELDSILQLAESSVSQGQVNLAIEMYRFAQPSDPDAVTESLIRLLEKQGREGEVALALSTALAVDPAAEGPAPMPGR